MADIIPGNVMLECGRHKLNADLHIVHSTVKTAMGQHTIFSAERGCPKPRAKGFL
jgi:hypothetical protein